MVKRSRKIISNLRNKYRFVLINDTSFAEVFSVRLTPLNILIIISSLLLVFAFLLYLLFAFTAMRHLIPSKISASDKQELIELNQEIENLKRHIDVTNQKSQVLQNLLNGNEAMYDSTSVRPSKIEKAEK
jgi:hypothetical protein